MFECGNLLFDNKLGTLPLLGPDVDTDWKALVSVERYAVFIGAVPKGSFEDG